MFALNFLILLCTKGSSEPVLHTEMVVCNLQMERGTLVSLLMGSAKAGELICFKPAKPLQENITMISAVAMVFADIRLVQYIVVSIGTACAMVRVFMSRKTGANTRASGKAT